MNTVNLFNYFSRESTKTFRQRSASFTLLFFKIMLIGVMSFGAITSARADRIFVSATDLNPNMAKDGRLWGSAFTTLEAGLLAVPAGRPTQIWIAAGEYVVPPSGPGMYAHIPTGNRLPDNVDIYGGFRGTENEISERIFLPAQNLPLYETRLFAPFNTYGYLFSLTKTTNIFNGLSFIGNSGIAQEGGTLTVISSKFFRDPMAGYVSAFGGNGILSYSNATLNVDKSLFENRLANRGGGIAGRNALSVTITNSAFINNRSIGGGFAPGGAIEINGNTLSEAQYGNPMVFGPKQATNLKITNSFFTNNVSFYDGGAISVKNAGDVAIIGGAFTGNSSPYYSPTQPPSYGGAVSVEDSGNVTITGTVFTGNNSTSTGGATHVKNTGKVTVTNSIFTNNFSYYSDGGALSAINVSGLEIKGSTFGSFENGIANPSNGNRADNSYGGAIYATSISGSLDVTSSKFYGNSSVAGGAIFSSAQDGHAKILITGSTFTGNQAGYGGAILDVEEMTGTAKTVSLAITQSTFSNNMASEQGPAIYYDGSEMSVNGRDLTTRKFSSVDEKIVRRWLISDNFYSLKDVDIFAALPP